MWNDAKIHFHGKFLRRLFRCSGERNDAIPSLRRGGQGKVHIAYIRLCPGNIEPRPFYRPELSSLHPGIYLIPMRRHGNRFFPIDQLATLARGVYLCALLDGKIFENNNNFQPVPSSSIRIPRLPFLRIFISRI